MTSLPGYRLEAVLGRGSMGTVHLGRRSGGSSPLVAIKRVPVAGDPELSESLRREAEALAGLDHPHIVQILEVVPDRGGVAIVMQYAPGGSLADLLARRGPLAAPAALALAAPLAEALASAHCHGVLHGDVKPSNVLLTSDGEPLLSDFGLARPLFRPSTEASTLVGTAEYLDPAVAGGAAADQRSDVYSLGVLCYQMLAGRPPFVARTPLAVLRAADRGDHQRLAGVAPGVAAPLARVVEQAMARRPQDRFATAASLAATLRALQGTAVPSGPPPAAAPPRPPARRAAAPAPATRSFGPRPHRPTGTPLVADPRSTARAVLSAAVAVVVVATVLLLRSDRSALPAAAAARPACPPVPSPLLADLDGDGCPSPVSHAGTLVEADGKRYQLGRAGDTLLLGDWDCDGRDTPALYRPSQGTVFLFRAWALPGRPVPAVAVERRSPHGTAAVVRPARGCDRVVVSPRAIETP